MNQTLLIALPIWVSAVPVFPATATPGIWAGVPVPSSTTFCIIPATALAVERFMTTDCSRGSIVWTVRPSESTILLVRWGTIRRPPSATAEATSAICSAVTSSLSWPMPMRPTSTWGLVGGIGRPFEYSPLIDISAGGIVELGLAVEAEAAHVAPEDALAEAHGDLGVDGVDGVHERFGEGDLAEALVLVVGQREAGDEHAVAAADGRFGRVAAGVDGGRGGDDLEGRAGGVAVLGGAVDERPGAAVLDVGYARREAQGVGFVGGVGDHHLHRPGARVERDDRAVVFAEGALGDPLGGRVECGDDLVADRLDALELVEDRLQVAVGLALEHVVAVLLQAGRAEVR